MTNKESKHVPSAPDAAALILGRAGKAAAAKFAASKGVGVG
jgi:hypothetical protein